MTDTPQPDLTVRWRYEGYREVAFWDGANLTPEALRDFAERVSKPIMFGAEDTQSLRAAIDRIVDESGLRPEYLISGHGDPLRRRFGVTLRPKE